MKHARLILPLILLSGCSLFGDGVDDELEEARRRWVRAEVAHYRFTLTLGCFCLESGPYLIEVQSGEIVAFEPLGEHEIPGDSLDRARLTIDDLFGFISEAFADDADEITVEYDPALGYPTSISIDYVREAVDEEIGYTVSDFVRLD
jgi:hypothetical protein